MSKNGKMITMIGIVIVVIAGAVFMGKGNFIQGRFDASDRNGGGSGREDGREFGKGSGEEVLPDLNLSNSELKLVTDETKQSYKGKKYFRVTSTFKNTGFADKNMKVDWKANINGKDYPYLALKQIPVNYASYSFDILRSELCKSNIWKAQVQTRLDSENKVIESNENNNEFVAEQLCPQDLDKITRCELVQAIYTTYNKSPGTIDPQLTMPSDVPKSSPCYNAVKYALSHNIVGVYQDGTFGPDKEVNRAEAAKILLNALNAAAPMPPSGFKEWIDVTKNDWFYESVMGLANYANNKGKLELVGFNDGFFRPTALATKAWVKAMIGILP